MFLHVPATLGDRLLEALADHEQLVEVAQHEDEHEARVLEGDQLRVEYAAGEFVQQHGVVRFLERIFPLFKIVRKRKN